MAGSIQKTKVVAATAQHSGTHIGVTYQGGPDHASVKSISFTLNGDDATEVSETHPSVGYTKTWGTVDGVAGGTTNHVVGVAEFEDGTQQVVLDTYV